MCADGDVGGPGGGPDTVCNLPLRRRAAVSPVESDRRSCSSAAFYVDNTGAGGYIVNPDVVDVMGTRAVVVDVVVVESDDAAAAVVIREVHFVLHKNLLSRIDVRDGDEIVAFHHTHFQTVAVPCPVVEKTQLQLVEGNGHWR